MCSMSKDEDPSIPPFIHRLNSSVMMLDRVVTVSGGRMNVSLLKPMPPSQRSSNFSFK